MMYLNTLKPIDMSGVESYVVEKIRNNSAEWIPQHKTLFLGTRRSPADNTFNQDEEADDQINLLKATFLKSLATASKVYGSLKKIAQLTTEMQDNKLDERMLQSRKDTRNSIEASVEKIAQAIDLARGEEAAMFRSLKLRLANISAA